MTMKEYILVTGGAGYIGSHTTLELIQSGYNVVVADNLVNSNYATVARIEFLVRQKVPFHKIDIGNSEELLKIFESYKIVGVIHFAALKAVGESTQIPLDYYYNNVRGTLSLLSTMKKADVKTIVFSSSATVYGDATRFKDMIPIPENCPTGATNPYGRTKLMIEEIIHDIYTSDPLWRAAILRYFNPIGAHESGIIGEDPLGIPNNLLPYLAQVAVGRREKLSVFGNDYDSHDGTPIRDYIHVMDLARGHISALEYLHDLPSDSGLYREWNLGTGKGSSVFDVYFAFCKAIGRELPYEVVGRRTGDVLNLTANPARANLELKWKATASVEDACKDLWKWTTENTYGFVSEHYSWRFFDTEPSEVGYTNRLHTLRFPDSRFEVSIANYGALIKSIKQNEEEYTLGYDTIIEYMSPGNPYFGATIGRFANRIRGGSLRVDGKPFDLEKNEKNTNTLHGGSQGFDKQFFLGPIVKQGMKGGNISLEFLHMDSDGQNGFPADLVTFVKYIIGGNSVEIELKAEIPELSVRTTTAVNLTNHSYFKVGSGTSIMGLMIKSATNRYLEVDSEKLPTGKILDFDDTIRSGLVLSESSVFDHCFVMEEEKKNWFLDTRQHPLRVIFEASHFANGGKIEFFSTEPAFQFYTANRMEAFDHMYRCGFCIEPSRFIDAVSISGWNKQVLLKRGDVYGSRMKYVFS